MSLLNVLSNYFKIAKTKRFKALGNLLKFSVFHNLYYPNLIEIEVSTKCNLNCPRCERQVAPKELLGYTTSIETINKISSIFPYIQFVSLVSGLGEPFLNPDFWEIIKIIKKAGPSIGYTTNGILLNQENIEKTIGEKVDIVVVSLDSLREDVYEKIRGGPFFDKVISNLKSLIEAKKNSHLNYPEIRIGFAFHKSTIEEIPNMVEFAHQLGADTVYCTALIANQENMVKESIYSLDPAYIYQIFKKAKEKALELGVKIRLPEITINNTNQLCFYPWQAMFIAYNGDVSCSSYFRYPKKQFFCVEQGKVVNQERDVPGVFLGNINQESILKIWNNEAYRALRRKIKSGDPQPPCDKCYFRYCLH